MGFLNESGLAYYDSLLKQWIRLLIDVTIGSFVEWSPEMTSNTTPSPYEVVASSNVTGHDPWLAFDGNDTGAYLNAWASLPSTTHSWIAFNFGSETPVGGLIIQARSYANNPQIMPSACTIAGSQNGNVWTTIVEYSDFTAKDDGERYEIKFPKIVNYAWYRVYINETGNKGFNEVKFLRPVNSLAVAEGINSV